MKRHARQSERGIAMMVVLFAMILVSVIGLALMFSTNAETGLNGGYRQTNLAYFAARSGVEEVRDRIRPTGDLPTLLPKVPIGSVAGTAPTAGVVYVTNLDATETTAAMYPWKLKDTSNNDNPYFDDELCHETADGTAIKSAPGDPSKPCPRTMTGGFADSLPTAAGWYNQQTAETLPGNATISYKWVRINLKMNESSSPWCVLGFESFPFSGTGHCAIQNPPTAHASHDQVCYNGKNEFVITKADEPLDVPGRVDGLNLPSQLAFAMGMYGGGSAGQGNSGHSTSGTGNGNGNNSSSSSSTTSGTGTTSTSSSSTGTTSTSSSSSSSSGSSSSSSSSGSSSSTGLVGTGSSSSSSSSSTGLIGTGSSSSSSSTGLIGTGSSSSSSSTGLIGTGSTSSSNGSSSSGSSSSSSSGSSSSSSSTGAPAASCGPTAPPLPGTPIGVGSTPIYAAACTDVEAQPVYVLTALAVAPNSSTVIKSKRMIQYEVARIALPPVPSALTLAGPNPNASFANSGNYAVTGIDAYPAGTVKNGTACGGQNMPAIGTMTDVGNPLVGNGSATDVATASRNTVITDLYAPGVKTGNYTGVDPCAAGVPDVQNVQNVANSLYSTPQGLNNLVQNVENAGNQFYPSGTSISNAILGTSGAPQVTVVNGDLTLSGSSNGAGILLVTGTLTFKGDFSYDGVILVVGNGIFQQNGGGQGTFTGAIVVANIAGNSNYATNPSEANLAAKLGPPTYGNSGGGGSSLTYSSCAIDIGMNSASYAVIARREITY